MVNQYDETVFVIGMVPLDTITNSGSILVGAEFVALPVLRQPGFYNNLCAALPPKPTFAVLNMNVDPINAEKFRSVSALRRFCALSPSCSCPAPPALEHWIGGTTIGTLVAHRERIRESLFARTSPPT